MYPGVFDHAESVYHSSEPFWPTKYSAVLEHPKGTVLQSPEVNTASTLDGIIWGRFMAIGPYGVSPFLMRSLHTVYPAVDLAEKPRIGV